MLQQLLLHRVDIVHQDGKVVVYLQILFPELFGGVGGDPKKLQGEIAQPQHSQPLMGHFYHTVIQHLKAKGLLIELYALLEICYEKSRVMGGHHMIAHIVFFLHCR